MNAPTMPHRITDFGLIAWLEQTRIQLPLRDVDCRFQMTGDVATVDLLQVFHQTAGQPLDITYSFPLPAGAAVYRCEYEVNGRIIKAVVMEENEARRTVIKQKAEGRRTALVEVERENLFTLSLGNAAPGDKLVIRFSYFQTADRLGAGLSLRIPVCPGLRYIPGRPLLRSNRGPGTEDDTDQVPDASRLSPPRIDVDHPDAARLYVEGRIDRADVDLSSAQSPSHSVIFRPESGQIHVRLIEDKPVPDRDFVLRWNEPQTSQAVERCWVTRHKDGLHALLQLRAPQHVAATDTWEQDVYFLVDRSGSMAGSKWEQCAQALQAFVRELGAQDRIWITCFESTFADFSDEPLPRDVILGDEEFLNINRLGTGGGTELLPALDHVLTQVTAFSSARRSRIILITDGQVGNEDEILQTMAAHCGLPVFCFGIDTAVNDAFLRSLAEQQRGRCTLMTPQDDIAAAVRSLAQALRRPVLTHLQLGEGLEQANLQHQLPDLHAGEVVHVPTLLGLSTRAVITGKLADGTPWSHEFELAHAVDSPAPELLWARERIQHLLRVGSSRQAVAVAIQHGLLCKGTAFIAWDETEKVPIAKREVYQPALLACARPMSLAADVNLHACADSAAYAQLACECILDDDIAALAPRPARRKRNAPASPDTASALLKRLEARYTDEPATARWQQWKMSFESCLKDRASVHPELHKAIVQLLGSWVSKLLGLGRLTKLEDLLVAMNKDHHPLRLLIAFVKTHLRGEMLADAEAWTTQALSSAGKASGDE